MIDVTITISGPGLCIQFETELIKKLFSELGYKIEIKDKYPFENNKPENGDTLEEYLDRRKKHTQERKNNGTPDVIKIITDHQLWGG